MADSDDSSRRDHDAARARAIIDNARDAIVTLDDKGLITDFNASAESIFGYTADEIVGRNIRLLMPAPYRDEHDGYIERYHRTGERRAIGVIREVLGQRKSGEVFPIELSVAEVHSNGQRFYTGIVRDVSEYHTTLEALKRERDFSTMLIDTTPTVVLVLDPQARVIAINRFMETLSGYQLSEIQGRDSFDVLVPEREQPRLREAFSRAVGGEGIRGVVGAIRTRSGEERIIEWYAEPLRDDDKDQLTGVLCGGEDISERRRAAQEIARLERRSHERERLADLGAVAAKLVHDLGNPVSGLSMQAELLLRRLSQSSRADDESIKRPTARIMAAVGRLNELVRGFMDFAREQRLELAPTDLPALVGEVVELWRPMATAREIELRIDVEGDIPRVRCDAAKLRRVFDNLVSNAVEAIDSGPGSVSIEISLPESGKVAVRVVDTGPGVSDGIEVFRLFETTKSQGTGIGLAVARQIVVAHGGGIEFASVQPHGAAFRVELPSAGPVEQADDHPPPP